MVQRAMWVVVLCTILVSFVTGQQGEPMEPSTEMEMLEPYLVQTFEGAALIYTGAGLLVAGDVFDDEDDLIIEEQMMALATQAEEFQAAVIAMDPYLEQTGVNMTAFNSTIEEDISDDSKITAGLLRVGHGSYLVANATAAMTTDPELSQALITTNLSSAYVDLVTAAESLGSAVTELGSPDGVAVAGRKLLQSTCEVDWATVNPDDYEDYYANCSEDQLWSSFNNLWTSIKTSFSALFDSIKNVWNDILDYECKFKSSISDDVMDYITDDNRINPCTSVGCSECVQPENDKSPTAGTKLIQEECDWIGDDEQKWVFKKVGTNIFQIQHDEWKNLCIAAPSGTGPATLADCESSPTAGSSQVFEVKELDKGTFGLGDDRFIIKSTSSSKCMGVEKNDDDEGIPIVFADCKCGPEQVFKGDD